VEQKVEGTKLTLAMVTKLEAKLSKERSGDVKAATPKGHSAVVTYPQEDLAAPGSAD
jgi:hypothetical protein